MIEPLVWVVVGAVTLYVAALTFIHPLGRRWLAFWYGTYEANQFGFYRCDGCRRIVSWRGIRGGGCGCGAIRLRPAILSLPEKARLLYLPWLGR
jgi:hypothetical protein